MNIYNNILWIKVHYYSSKLMQVLYQNKKKLMQVKVKVYDSIYLSGMQWCLEIETYENEIFADRYSLSASWSDGIYQISARPGSSPVLSLPSTLALFFTTPPTKTCTYRTYLCPILFLSLSYTWQLWMHFFICF